jgi:hypothetical protein
MTDPAIPGPAADADAAVARVRRNAIVLTLLLAAALGLWMRSLPQALGVIGAGALMLLTFQGLATISSRILKPDGEGPSALQAVFLAGRYVLLGIVLYAMVLMPGVGPVPVAVGLSVLVLAILLEAFIQLFAGASREP